MSANKRRAWYVISLRPQGGHDAVRTAARRHGAKLLALSPWRLQARTGGEIRTQLQAALACDVVVFTSPAAVKFAQALQPLHIRGQRQVLALGAGTAQALHRAGIDTVQHPRRMDSEGLLELPALLHADEVGLVTAPGGRDLIAAALRARGARIVRADVYARARIPVSAHALQTMRELDAPAAVLVSSGEALQVLFAQLDDADRLLLLHHPAVVASTRLRQLAHALGFSRIAQAAGPRPAQLAHAAAQCVHLG